MTRCFSSFFRICGLFLFTLFLSNALRAQCNLSCQESDVNVSLSIDGTSEITADIFVTGMTGPCQGDFTIQLFNMFGVDVGTTADCSMVGTSLTARITHDNSGNFCETTLNIEDKIGPLLTCPNDTVNCSASVLPADVALVLAEDNCDPAPALNFSQSAQTQLCSGEPFNRIITRTYTAVDFNGNTGENTCTQPIFVRAAELDSIVFPPNFDDTEEPALGCSVAYPDSTVTGFPTLFGEAVQEVCKINVFSSDQVLNLCNGTYKILRTWTVIDCCTGETRSDLQLIKVADTTPPTVVCPDTLTVGTDANVCTATVNLPTLAVADDCSATTEVTIFSPFGTINANGGTVQNVPEGNTTFNYRVRDACNNESLCALVVTVADDEAPTLLCEQFIDVSIGTAGSGTVAAIDLDEGSFDNCCTDLTFAVRRAGEGDSFFADSEVFDCSDLGLQMLVLRVTDCNGFSNVCNIQAEIEDKTAPLIMCPPPVTLDCTEFPAATATAGSPNTFDNCGIAGMSISEVENLNACNTGTVLRTFTVNDAGGLSASCTQTINFTDTTPFTAEFPADTVIGSCNGGIPPPLTAQQLAPNNDCEIPQVNVQDEEFDTGDPCTIKILRTYTVADMCSGVSFTDVQEIIVTDDDAPFFNEVPGALDVSFSCDESIILPPPPTANDLCTDAAVVLANDEVQNMLCAGTFTRVLTYEATDDCGNAAVYTVNINVSDTQNPVIECPTSITTFALANCVRDLALPPALAADNCSDTVTITNDSPFADNSGAVASGTYEIGSTNITFTATDECGNTASCQTVITVNDVAGPSMFCNSPVNVYIALPDTTALIEIDSIDAGSFDACSPPAALTIDINKAFCEDIGAPLTVTLTGTDAAGNMNICTSDVFVLDTIDICENERPALTVGTVRLTNGEPLSAVAVSMQDDFYPQMCTTAESGLYYFYRDFSENPCQITPYSNEDITEGVTTWDLLMIKRHVLQTELFTSPYQYFAADVNRSGTVSMADVVEIRRVILGIQPAFNQVNSWQFFVSDHIFPEGENPLESENVPTEYLMTQPAWEEFDLDFTAVKSGDVSGTE